MASSKTTFWNIFGVLHLFRKIIYFPSYFSYINISLKKLPRSQGLLWKHAQSQFLLLSFLLAQKGREDSYPELLDQARLSQWVCQAVEWLLLYLNMLEIFAQYFCRAEKELTLLHAHEVWGFWIGMWDKIPARPRTSSVILGTTSHCFSVFPSIKWAQYQF